MSRVARGRLILACLFAACVAIGQAADTEKAAKKPAQQGEKKPAADKNKVSAEKPADQKKSGDKKPDAKKPDAKKPDDKGASKKDGGKKGSGKPVADKEDATKEAADKPAKRKLKKGPFHIEVDLEGVFEAQNQAELYIRPQEWALPLTVLNAVEHGAAVKQGDLVLALDTEKIDRAIADLRCELQLNEVALKESSQQLASMEKIAPLDAQLNERNRRMNEEDWKQYQEVDKPLTLKLTDFRLRMAQEGLTYAEEEYRQLEKMYKADDLKEETERIVLRRAKNGVDRAKLEVEFAKASHDEAVKLSLPRMEERTKDQTERARIDAEFAKVDLPLLMSKHRLEVEKLQVAHKQNEDRLKKLIADRDAMFVKAPIDGIVYYGRPVRGKWSAPSTETLRRGSPIMPNDVFMTIVQTRPLIIHTSVPESHAQQVRAGVRAVVEPTGFADLKLTAIVQRVAAVPMGGGGFDCQLTVSADGLSSAIVPGMNCDLKLVPYKKTDDLTVPTKAVFSEDFDPAIEYVYLVGKDGKPQKRVVTLGQRNDKQVEVLKGLAEGDEILLDKPKDKDKDE